MWHFLSSVLAFFMQNHLTFSFLLLLHDPSKRHMMGVYWHDSLTKTYDHHHSFRLTFSPQTLTLFYSDENKTQKKDFHLFLFWWKQTTMFPRHWCIKLTRDISSSLTLTSSFDVVKNWNSCPRNLCWSSRSWWLSWCPLYLTPRSVCMIFCTWFSCTLIERLVLREEKSRFLLISFR